MPSSMPCAKALVAIDDSALANIRLYFGDASELARLAARCIAFAHRSALSRSVAEAAALESGDSSRTTTLTPARAHPGSMAASCVLPPTLPTIAALARVAAISPRFCLDAPNVPTTGASRGSDFGGTRYEAKAKREGRCPAYFIFPRSVD